MKRRLYYFFFAMLVIQFIGPDEGVLAQVGCPDGQGVNALTNGDFGFGIPNVLGTDPGIAPGYTYTTNPPPQDGLYTITNNTGPWGSFAGNWIDITDNSPDPNGYMMVVNASFDPGIFYAQQVDVCGGSEYEFSADIINLLLPSLPDEILPNVDFLVDGQVFYSTGNIAQNGQWQSVGFTFTTQTNQTSVLIEIRNNAPGGQGNDLALDNIAFFTCGPLITIDAPDLLCGSANDSILATTTGGDFVDPVYQWQQSLDGISWTDIPGATSLKLNIELMEDNYFRVITADGATNLGEANCRVVSDPVFVFHFVEEVFDTLYWCIGDEVEIGDSLITSAGDFDIDLASKSGCDSLLHLHVIPVEPKSVVINDSICAGEEYENQVYFNSTSIVKNLESAEGCDSTVAINLFVEQLDVNLPSAVTINQGESYTLDPSFAGNALTYSWSPDTAISCTDCPTPTVDPLLSTTYELNIVTSQGCMASASISIEVLFESNIYIPNAFSPNNDGINDLFTAFTNKNIVSMERFYIYDRWGAAVFQANNVPISSFPSIWDGTINNQKAQEGIYTYFAEFISVNKEVTVRKGEVLLMR